MKKVAFAWQTFWYDFDNLEEARQYVNSCKYHKETQDDTQEGADKYIRINNLESGYMSFGRNNVTTYYTVVVMRPIGNYNTGI